MGPRPARRRPARLAAAAAGRAPAAGGDVLVLATHASPGSQTEGFDAALDPNVTIERVTRTDARVICCGHTHLPEVRDLGRKLIVNAGSVRLRLRRRPDRVVGARRRRRRGRSTAEIRRTEFDALAVERRAVRARPARRRLPGGNRPHRAARPMSHAREPRGSWSPAWAPCRPSGIGVEATWAGLVAGRVGRAHDRHLRSRPGRPARSPARSCDFDASAVLDRKEIRRTDRYTQFGLVAAREALDQAGLPGPAGGRAWPRRPGSSSAPGLGGVGHARASRSRSTRPAGPDRVSPFFIPMAIANVGAGPDCRSASARMGPNFATVSACATGGHAIGEACEIDPPRRRRRHGRGRRGGGRPGGRSSAASARCARCPPATTIRPAPPGRSTTAATASSSARAAAMLVLEELEPRPARAAPSRWPSWSATARPPTPSTSPCRRRAAAARVRAARGALAKAGLRADDDRPRQRPCHVHAGRRQGRARGVPDDPRRARARRSRSRPTSRCSATPWARPARSRRSPRSRRSATGLVPPTINLTDPDAGRPRPRPDPARPRGQREVRTALTTRSASAARTRALIFTGSPDDRRPARRRRSRDRTPGLDAPDRSLARLIDRLAPLLERSELTELEVEAGGTGLVLRKPAALRPAAAPVRRAEAPCPGGRRARRAAAARAGRRGRRPSVKAPLTGHLLHLAVARVAPLRPGRRRGHRRPGHRPDRGDEAVQRDQERPGRSRRAGRAPRAAQLVKAKQPLIEVEPL